MDEAALYEWLANAEQQNPGALQKMIDAGLFGDRMGVEGQTLGIGKGLWDTPMAQGTRTGGEYGTYVAASPVEHLSNALSKVLGGAFIGQAQQNERGLIGQKGQGMEALIRAMANQQGQKATSLKPNDPNAAAPWDPYANRMGSI